MEAKKKPIFMSILINLMITAIVIASAGYIYTKFFSDLSEKNVEQTNIEAGKTQTVDFSKQFSKTAFKLAAMLAFTLITLHILVKTIRIMKEEY